MQLLVSPKNIEEARITVNSGVDYVDCKNPDEGSLGANFPWIINQMKELIPGGSPQKLSAAIGDFPYLPGSASLAALGAAISGADIIKVGLKGPKNVEEGVNLMKNVVKAVKNYNKDIKIVVAGYADYKRIKTSPDFLSIPLIAAESGSDIAMLDTFVKDGKGLFDFLSVEQLMDFKKISKQANLDIALAGNLMKESISKIKKISPDIIGVRSIVCDNFDRRKGKIRAHMIEELKNYLYLDI
ncbi:MAG: (5-formylfuran-3-yl)methyl phosphate synthase [Candidatus Lokiarchaeota archaeon]|nr:(5-formylfuran-3-yl)methyl phosphate synthase [Candidatus Lokiarchaeota archaeon]